MYRIGTLFVLLAAMGISTQVIGQTSPPAATPASRQVRILPINPPWVPPAPLASQPVKGAGFEVAESVYSWGEVWEGEPVNHVFQIKNTGTQQLEIRDAKADCHCTVPGNFDRYIPPGGTGMVPFTFNSTGLQKFNQKGCTITTNDTEKPQFRVYLQGFVRTVVELIPVSGGAFGRITDPDEIVESRMELISHVDEPIKLTLNNPPIQPAGAPPLPNPISPEPGKPLVVRGGGQLVGGNTMPGGSLISAWDLKVEEVVPGKKWNVTLSTAPPLNAGWLSYQYRFSTGHPRLPVWTLYASGQRPERISADPPNMIFPNQFSQNMPPPKITIENYGKTPFKILSVAKADPDFPLEPKVIEEGGKYKIQVTAPEGYSLPKQTSLIVTTDDPQISKVTVPVFSLKPQPGLPPLQPKPTFTAPPVASKPPAATQAVAPAMGGSASKGGK